MATYNSVVVVATDNDAKTRYQAQASFWPVRLRNRWRINHHFLGPGDRDWGTEIGDQRGMNGSRSKFLSKSIRRPISRKSPQTLNLRYEHSYGLAISQQHTLENFAEAKEPIRCESQNTAEGTGQTAHWDRSDWSGWSRRPRPVRPVAPRQPATKAPNGKSRANEVQI